MNETSRVIRQEFQRSGAGGEFHDTSGFYERGMSEDFTRTLGFSMPER